MRKIQVYKDRIIGMRNSMRGVNRGNWQTVREPSEKEQAEAEARIRRLKEKKA